MNSERIILGIETSCDETAVGVVRGMQVLANCIASSSDLHAQYGGVVPELAARAHVDYIIPTLESALCDAGVALSDVDAFAVTAGPGLSGCLLVGASCAKMLAVEGKKPIYAINHLAGHIAAGFGFGRAFGADFVPCALPCVVLLASGGHTNLFMIDDRLQIQTLGGTIDDAAGEAVDKAARLLGLGYPGGAALDLLARWGNSTHAFPRALSSAEHMQKHMYNFSFSGLKTALLRQIVAEAGGAQHGVRGAAHGAEQSTAHSTAQSAVQDSGSLHTLIAPGRRADLAASFVSAVADVLVAKSIAACTNHKIDNLLVVGGVAANSQLRTALQEECRARGIELTLPPLSLCGDNGAMIALAAAMRMRAGGGANDFGFAIDPSSALCQF